MVVKDVRVWNTQLYYVGCLGCILLDDSDAPMFTVTPPNCRGSVVYPWEGHQVFDTGLGPSLDVLDYGWSIRMSGYLLSLP